MKYKPSVIVLFAALALMLTVTIQAQTTNPPHLAQFPSVERVKSEVKGTDALNTAARQSAAFGWLSEIVMNVSGSSRSVSDADGTRIRRQYLDALQTYDAVAYPLLRGNESRWRELQDTYRRDPVFGDDLLKRFFTADLRAEYYKWSGSQPPAASVATQPPSGAEQTNTKTTTPTNTPANGSAKDYYNQGKKYYEAKDYAKAVEAFKKVIALEPSADRYKVLALSYANLNQYPEAVAAIQQAIRFDSNDYQNPQLLGIFFIRMGQYEKAIAPLNEAIRLKPNETDAPYVHNNLGRAYYFLERFSEAATAFQQAVRLKPNNAEFLNNLGSTYVDLRRKADALQIYEKLQTIDQAKAKALKDDIDIYLKDVDAKDLAGALFFLGSYSLENNDYSGASKAFYHAIALKSPASINLPEAHDARGKAFVGLERYDKAIAEYREAIRLDPKEPEYQLDLGKAYLAAGQKVQAQQVYQKLLTLNKVQAQKLLTEINKLK